jgi:hypothetical protein
MRIPQQKPMPQFDCKELPTSTRKIKTMTMDAGGRISSTCVENVEAVIRDFRMTRVDAGIVE